MFEVGYKIIFYGDDAKVHSFLSFYSTIDEKLGHSQRTRHNVLSEEKFHDKYDTSP